MQTNPHLPLAQPRKMGNLRKQKLQKSLSGLHCHPGHLIQGDEQAPSPERGFFPSCEEETQLEVEMGN